MTSTVKDSAKAVKPAVKPPWGVLVELEGTAVPTRAVMYAAVVEALKKDHPDFGLPPFLAHGLHAVPAQMADDLASHLKLKAAGREKLLQAVLSALTAHFTNTPVLTAGLDRLLDGCVAADAKIAVLSWQPEREARALAERVGLMKWKPALLSFSEVHHEFPGPDTYLRGLKPLGSTPHRSIALVTSRPSSHAALAAGMRCAVVPDEYTGFQDFSGADWVADAWTDLEPASLFAD
jgi:beta-phosphoglucomutase-like phosphatase (HAD superfamily)